jgi:hypothetical protein
MSQVAVTLNGRRTRVGRQHTRLWDPLYDLNEKVWHDLDTSILDDGPVASFEDRVGGMICTQSVSASRPTMSAAAGGMVHAGGITQNMLFPNNAIALRQYRALAWLFKAAPSLAPSSDGSLLAVNGPTGSLGAKQPLFGYDRSPAQYKVNWDTNLNAKTVVPAGDENAWHLITHRRLANGQLATAIDGGAEVLSVETNFVPVRVITTDLSYLGDFRTSSIPWTFKRGLLFQEFISDAELARLQGWGMWLMGVQANLPGSHLYASAPPKTSPFYMPLRGNSLDDWNNEIIPSWPDETYQGQPIASLITDYTEVWKEGFDTNTITDDTTGTGPIYAPVQDDTKIFVTQQRPGDTPNVLSQAGSDAIITVTKSGGNWYASNLSTVNRDGRGLTWDPRLAPTMFEAKFRCEPDGEPLYVAFWTKDAQEFWNGTMPRIEIDWVEAYRSGPTDISNWQHHGSYHNWDARRLYGDRLAVHKFKSNITALKVDHGWTAGDINIFDGNYHTFGGIINATSMIYFVDGFEIFRIPSRPDMYRPMYCLLSALVWNDSPTSGSPKMYADYIRVLQHVPVVAQPPITFDRTDVTFDQAGVTFDQ